MVGLCWLVVLRFGQFDFIRQNPFDLAIAPLRNLKSSQTQVFKVCRIALPSTSAADMLLTSHRRGSGAMACLPALDLHPVG